jgi:hypothetical protein
MMAVTACTVRQIRIIKLSRMRLAGHIAYLKKKRKARRKENTKKTKT